MLNDTQLQVSYFETCNGFVRYVAMQCENCWSGKLHFEFLIVFRSQLVQALPARIMRQRKPNLLRWACRCGSDGCLGSWKDKTYSVLRGTWCHSAAENLSEMGQEACLEHLRTPFHDFGYGLIHSDGSPGFEPTCCPFHRASNWPTLLSTSTWATRHCRTCIPSPIFGRGCVWVSFLWWFSRIGHILKAMLKMLPVRLTSIQCLIVCGTWEVTKFRWPGTIYIAIYNGIMGVPFRQVAPEASCKFPAEKPTCGAGMEKRWKGCMPCMPAYEEVNFEPDTSNGEVFIHAPRQEWLLLSMDLQRMLDQAVTVTEPVTVNGAHRHHQYLG